MSARPHERDGGPDRLFTDLYELTMMQSYFREGLTGESVFSLFVRRLPEKRNYLLAAGLAGVLDFLETFRFTSEDLSYLATLGIFADDFIGWLKDFHFTGDIYATPEGTPVFANEPLVEVVAPLPEAQYFETFIMNQIHLQTLLASKASRVVTAARGRNVIDFGARRMHGTHAAIHAARAFHIAGVAATSNVAAGRAFGIPVAGTMGHSYIQAHETERAAYMAFTQSFPGTILLIDTYDTIAGVKRVIDLARSEGDGFRISGVRLDSGDLAALSRQVRHLLDEAGMHHIQIIASGGLDEYEIERLTQAGAPIDAFGVGTAMGVSTDAPALDIAYKLTEYQGRGRLKLSSAKATLPGRKQVFRHASGDSLARHDEALDGAALLQCVMRNGRRLATTPEPIDVMRARARKALGALPSRLLALGPAEPPYPVEISASLAAYERAVRAEITAAQAR